MERKHTPGARVKQLDEANGKGLAVIATLGVVDKDMDVTLPGAFGEQQVKMVPAHDWGHVPIGKAALKEVGNEAVAEFALNLDIPAARDWYSALKYDLENGQPLQEWSYGFTILDSELGQHEGADVRFLKKMSVHEISPVMLGAGENTRTVAIKEQAEKRAVPAHTTAVQDGTWDGPANNRRVKAGEAAAYYRKIFAWQDAEADSALKGSWRFIHHYVDSDGKAGAASVRAAVTGIAVLNGARGGTTIPEADRAGVHRHLARHLRDADANVPELRSAEECAVKLVDQIHFALWDVEAAFDRCKAVQEHRKATTGRDLSPDRLDDIEALDDLIGKLHETAKALQASVERGTDPAETAAMVEAFQELNFSLMERARG